MVEGEIRMAGMEQPKYALGLGESLGSILNQKEPLEGFRSLLKIRVLISTREHTACCWRVFCKG